MKILVSADLAAKAPDLQSIEPWLDADAPVWEGAAPLGVFLSANDKARYESSDIAVVMEILKVPVSAEKSLPDFRAAAMAARCDRLMGEAQDERAATAALRRDFMHLQRKFATAEDFLYGAFAPKFVCARLWEFSGDTISLSASPLRQRLPVGSAGVAAVDLWATKAGDISVQLCRATGAPFTPIFDLTAAGAGWVRAQLDVPLTGFSEDVILEVSGNIPLGLSLATPLDEICAVADGNRAAAPLALQIWKSLPGVRLPNMSGNAVETKRHIIPVSGLPKPEVLGSGSAKVLRDRDAISLHPGHDGNLEIMFRGLEVAIAGQMAVFVQNFGLETVKMSIGVVNGATARRAYVHQQSHSQIDVDLPHAGTVDLVLKLRASSPVASVFLWGAEMTPLSAL